jgi:hypothetical protein
MSDKRYSLSKAIRDVLKDGAPRGIEAEHHYAEMRARESGSKLSFLASANAGGAGVLHVPLSAMRTTQARRNFPVCAKMFLLPRLRNCPR